MDLSKLDNSHYSVWKCQWNHYFHYGCLLNVISTQIILGSVYRCPYCNVEIKSTDNKLNRNLKINFLDLVKSSKNIKELSKN